MPGVGDLMVGLLGGPDPAQQLGARITPNPNPLQQPPGGPQAGPGGPGGVSGANVPPDPNAPPAPAQGPPQPPSQTTSVDPTTAQLIFKMHSQDQAAADFTRNSMLMASAFGTAQQQHDMMTMAQGVQPDDRVKVLAQAQNIQAEQTKQDMQARAAAGAETFAQSMGLKPGQGTEIFNSGPQAWDEFVQAHFRDVSKTEAQKNADALGLSYAVSQGYGSDPTKWTPDQVQEIEQQKSNVLSQAIGGADPAVRAMNAALRTWQQQPENKGKIPPDYLTDPVKYKSYAESQIKTDVGKADDLRADKANFQPALQGYDETIGIIDKLKNDPALKAGLSEFLGQANQYKPNFGLLTANGRAAKALYDQLMAKQYVAGVQDFKGAGRISQSELNQDAPSQSTMGKLNQEPDAFFTGMDAYRDKLANHRANLFGKAQQLDHPDLSDEDYVHFVNPIYKPGGDLQGTTKRNIPDFSKMSEADAETAYSALPAGQVFIGPDGKGHKK